MATTLGSGSIVQIDKDKTRARCRKWRLKVSTGKDPRTGKYGSKSRRFEGTYTQAKAALRKFVEEVDGDKVQGRTTYTFEQYCDRFASLRDANHEIAATTLLRQRELFKAASRHIGKANIAAVTPTMLNDMYVAMLKGDTLSGRKSSGAYVNQIHDNIKLVFDFAIKEGVLTTNPCLSANPPRSDTKEKRALRPDQVRDMVAQLDPREEHDCAYLLAIAMGLRRGEICGLSWGDIDFERGIVDICHSYDTLGNLKQTKTKAGMRLLPLPPSVANALLVHKEAQLARYNRTNQWRKPDEGYMVQDNASPVISQKSGYRVLPTILSNWWTADRVGLGPDGWCLHERHTYLTLLAMNGVHPKVMQELAGHYSSQITMDIYTHVNMDSKRQAVAALSGAF